MRLLALAVRATAAIVTVVAKRRIAASSHLPPAALRRRLLTALLVVAPPSGALAADTDAVFERAYAAHGGKALETLETLSVAWAGEDFQVFQDRVPGPPWDTARLWHGRVFDLTRPRTMRVNLHDGSGYIRLSTTLTDRKQRWHYDHRARTQHLRDGADFNRHLLSLARETPAVTLAWLARQEQHPSAGAPDSAHRSCDAAGLEALPIGGSPPVTYFIDEEGLVRCAAFAYTDYQGESVPVSIGYHEYRRVAGIAQPRRYTHRAHGTLQRDMRLADIAVDESPAPYFLTPEDYTPVSPAPADFREFRVRELAPGVFFVGQGVMYQLFVVFEDFVIALDGSSGDVERRIRAFRERVPHKPFRYVLASHHHSDHLHGLDEFVRRGAAVLHAPAHAGVIRRHLDGLDAELIAVDGERRIAQGERELRILDLGPLPHSEHLLAAHLPSEQLLFEADLFVRHRGPVTTATPNMVGLYRALTERGIQAARIVDPHTPLIATFEDLVESVRKRAAWEPPPSLAELPWVSARQWLTALGANGD